MLLGIVLAGGSSTRMGSPKALLSDDRGEPFIVRISRSMIAAGLDHLIVVSGHEHDSIVAALEADPLPLSPKVVRNFDPSRGQLSSLWTGMDEISLDTEAIVVTPVDVPLVKPETIRTVVQAWQSSRAPVVRPAVGVRRGHPVVFDRTVFEELRRAPLEAGARAVVRAHVSDILDVPVDDPACIVDIDTPADYQSHIRRLP